MESSLEYRPRDIKIPFNIGANPEASQLEGLDVISKLVSAQERNGITPLRFMALSDGGLFYYETVDCIQSRFCVVAVTLAEDRYCKSHVANRWGNKGESWRWATD